MEIIFINDGSKDNTKNLLDNLVAKDSRVVVIHKENGGVSSARNVGLDIVKGEYISFYDVDDRLDSHFFEVLLNDIFKHDVDIAVCQYNWEDCYGHSVNHDAPELFDRVFSTADQYYEIYYRTDIFNVTFSVVWGKIFNKSSIKTLRFNESIAYGEDLLFMMTVFSLAPKMYFDSFNGYSYLFRENSAVQLAVNNVNKINKYNADHMKVSLEIYKIVNKCCRSKVIEIAKNNTERKMFIVLYCLIKNNEKEYYKQNKKFFKKIIKDMDFKNVPFKQKLYLKMYLFSSPLCWLISRSVTNLQKIKAK